MSAAAETPPDHRANPQLPPARPGPQADRLRPRTRRHHPPAHRRRPHLRQSPLRHHRSGAVIRPHRPRPAARQRARSACAPQRCPARRRTGARQGSIRAPRAPAAPHVAAEADPGLAHLPTPEQIAAEVRRKPIGAVIADICRDLGITGSHPLWREVQRAIILHGGNLARLVSDILDRAFPLSARLLPAVTPAALRLDAPDGTGPP